MFDRAVMVREVVCGRVLVGVADVTSSDAGGVDDRGGVTVGE